jgi:hypothetical protein
VLAVLGRKVLGDSCGIDLAEENRDGDGGGGHHDYSVIH